MTKETQKYRHVLVAEIQERLLKLRDTINKGPVIQEDQRFAAAIAVVRGDVRKLAEACPDPDVDEEK